MGLYQQWLFPRLLDLTMRQGQLVNYRRRTVSAARGTVLEVGIGSGLNLPLYGQAVDRLYGIDPSPQLLRMAQKRIAGARHGVLLVRASGEALPIADQSIDTVVTTWTLCTIPHPLTALREMRRVLRPDGRLLFVEHGRSPEAGVEHWQNRLTPCWKGISGGCHLNRKMDDLIRTAGFEIGEIHTSYMEGPKLFTFMYQGWAHP